MPRALKSTAKPWPQSQSPKTKYRDRGTAHLPDGSSKPVTGYGATKQAATQSLYAKIEALELLVPQAETITVTQLYAEFIQHKRSVKGNKAKTIFDDMGMFKRHIQPAIGETPLAQLTLPEVQRVQHALTSEGKWRSAERCTILLKALLTFATKRYRAEIAAGRVALVLRDDVDNIKRPPGSKRKVNPLWTLAQVKAFLALSQAQYAASWRSIMYPLFYTALETGLRRGELIGLGRGALKQTTVKGRPQHYLQITEQLIDYGGKYHHDSPKTPTSARDVPITDQLARVLQAHMARVDRFAERKGYTPNTLMFPSLNGKPVGIRNLYRAKDALIEKLGLTPSTMHEMRKSSVTHFTAQLMREGVYSPKLVSKRIGHSRTTVALEVYTLLNQEDYMGATLVLSSLGSETGMDMDEKTAVDDEAEKT